MINASFAKSGYFFPLQLRKTADADAIKPIYEVFSTPLSHRPTQGAKFAWRWASPGAFCVGRAVRRTLRGDYLEKSRHFPDFRLSDFPKMMGIVARCVGIERIY